MNSCVILIIFCVLRSSSAIYQLSDDEYEQMPPLVSLDPFQPCLSRPGGRYCTAYATFLADGDSPLLTMMQKYSEHKSVRFNHTRALFGTCVTHKCNSKEHEYTTSDPRTYLERCLNRTVWNDYKLSVKVDETVFCYEHGEKKADIGAMDIAVAGLILALVMCNIVGNLCDIFCPKHWTNGLAGQYLQYFSIPRNWKILTAPPDCSDVRLERLKGIYGVRAISMTLVILTHALLPCMLAPLNTKFVEDQYETSYMHVLLNGTVIMQTFLFLSSFLLVYSLQLRSSQLSCRTLPAALVRRWLRLTPAYAVILGVTATWLRHIGTGPMWGHMVVQESNSCRRDWWLHLVYVNNYVDTSLCMPQAWYLATDTQLYCLGLVICSWCHTARRRAVVLSALLVVGLVCPALHTYWQNLDGPLLASPGTAVGMFITDRTFNEIYKRAHTNLSCYMLGMGAAYLVCWLHDNKYDVNKLKARRVLYWALFPLALSIPLSCRVFYSSPPVGLPYRVGTAALMKPVFGLLVGAIILGTIFKVESVYRGVLEWGGWVRLSRLSYSAYLVHVAYIRTAFSGVDHPVRISYLRGGAMVVVTVSAVYICALVFWLTVEAPLAHLARTWRRTHTKMHRQ